MSIYLFVTTDNREAIGACEVIGIGEGLTPIAAWKKFISQCEDEDILNAMPFEDLFCYELADGKRLRFVETFEYEEAG